MATRSYETDPEMTPGQRAEQLFVEHQKAIYVRTDRLFAALLIFEWLLEIVLAFTVSPRAWAGASGRVDPHVWASLLLGGAIISLPVWLVARYPGRAITRHVIAVAQMMTSALLIHLTGGRIETHFHVFGSLAFLAFYRDWRVFIPATGVVAIDHLLRGMLWPQSLYGVGTPDTWRWLEYSGWVVFEDVFLILACRQSVAEMRSIAERQAQLESINQLVERAVDERTRELAESEARFEAFMENSPAAAWMKNEGGSYIYANRAYEQALGLPRADIVGKSDRDRLDPDSAQRLEATDQEVLASGHVTETLETEANPDGTNHQWAVHRFALPDKSKGRLTGGIAIDVTEKLRLAERLRESQRMEAVGRLAGGIAHEFNNLLATITGYAGLLLQQLPAHESNHRYVSEISKSAERAAGLTGQLLAFTRQQVLQPKVIDLNQTLSDIEQLLRRLLGADIELRVDRDPALFKVKADPDQIEQAIINLVTNGRDAMPNGGNLIVETSNADIVLDVIGLEGTMVPGAYVLLTVTDTGRGMDAETKAKIFEPFFTTKEVGIGTGLGLATVHGIVHQSGGYVFVYSEVGIGTTFRIYLPAVRAGDTSKEDGSENGSAPPQGWGIVLLVDDEDGIRGLVGEVLRQAGYEVLEAASGEAAVKVAIEAPKIDALVADVVLSGMSGRAMADKLVELRPNLRVLFMSGYPGSAVVRDNLLRDGDVFIQKPFMPDQLVNKVRDLFLEERVPR